MFRFGLLLFSLRTCSQDSRTTPIDMEKPLAGKPGKGRNERREKMTDQKISAKACGEMGGEMGEWPSGNPDEAVCQDFRPAS